MKRKREGKELRRARNIVKKWREQAGNHVDGSDYWKDRMPVWDAIAAMRYEKAAALILAYKLRNS